MILTVDVGNTNIVFGCTKPANHETVFEERLVTDLRKTAIEYAITFKTILDWYKIKPEDIEGGILSSSVPPVTAQIKSGIERLLGKSIIEVCPGIKTGVDIKLDDPSQLGPDLLVGAVAGLAQYGAPLILIDMGTATTISVINDQKRFLGGMIIPGVRVALEGLTNNAAHLPEIAIEKPAKLIAGNTVGAMQSGSVYGQAACIDGMIDRIWEELGYETAVVAAGGFAGTIIPNCKHKITVDPELLPKGLTVLYEKNAKHSRKKD